MSLLVARRGIAAGGGVSIFGVDGGVCLGDRPVISNFVNAPTKPP